MIVVKFGGTSVADASAIRRAAEIVRGRLDRRPIVVVSALPPKAAIHAPWEASPMDLAAAGVELGVHYPRPVVDHAQARERTLQRYGAIREGASAA